MSDLRAEQPRYGCRPHGTARSGSLTQTEVVRVDPPDRATKVFRDTPILLHFSQPIDAASVSAETLWVEDNCGVLPGERVLSPDGQIVIWKAASLLTPGATHHVVAAGLCDRHGGRVETHISRFVPGHLAWRDLAET